MRLNTPLFALLLVFIHILTANSALPEQIHVSLMDDPRSMAISWVTSERTPTSSVKFGTRSGSYTRTENGSPHSYAMGSLGEYRGVIHDVILRGLDLSTTYFYRVGDDSHGWSREYNFTTRPSFSRISVRIGVVADMGVSGEAQQVVNLLKEEDFDLILLAGDISYANGDDGSRWDTFFRMIEPSAASTAWMTAMGNHEGSIDHDGAPYLNRYVLPNNELWYSFDYGPLHIISVNTEYTSDEAQRNWLTNDLARANGNRNNVPWIIIVGHKPMYSSNTNHGSYLTARTRWESLFKQYGVDLCLWGHDHSYERTYPVNNEVPSSSLSGGKSEPYISPSDPIHVVSGMSGARLYGGFDPQPRWSRYREASYGYTRFEINITQNSLHYEFLRLNRQVGDEFYICKTSTCYTTSGPITNPTNPPTPTPTNSPTPIPTNSPTPTPTNPPTTPIYGSQCGIVQCGSENRCCNDVRLGNICYNPTTHSCLNSGTKSVLCGKNASVCDISCFDPASYKCCSGQLFATNEAVANC
jgi:3',5'-cyclic AMP phosphodiesterase CpdA